MDTRLKNYRFSVWLKLLAVVMVVAGMLAVAYGSMKAPYMEYAFQTLQDPSGYQNTEALQLNRQLGQLGIYQILAGKLLFLAGVVYLIYAAGRRPDSDGVQVTCLDRPFLDLEALVILPAIIGCGVAVVRFYEVIYPVNLELFYVFSVTTIVMATLLGILLGTSTVKRLKRRELLRHTLAGAIVLFLLRKGIGLLRHVAGEVMKSRLSIRLSLLLVMFSAALLLTLLGTAVLTAAMGFGGILTGGVLVLLLHGYAVLFLLKKLSLLEQLTEGTERIRSGELSYRIPETGVPETDALATNINQIAEGLKASVSNEVKAERMKAELVTNVSHDLKTPLTSIITYIDLLKNEGLCTDQAPGYLDILDQKAQRLKTLTEDLFEAARISSGNVAAAEELLDLNSFIQQGLGELSDRIETSGLDFRVLAPEEKVLAKGDGRLLWRLMENLFSNVFKYAHPGSRVYVEIGQSETQAVVTVKNISAFELTQSPEELMERFKRGDESRHSEGSGLGLSIAASLAALQGGTFRIETDGDLFKAIVGLPVWKEVQ